MSIKLRKKALKSQKESLYLDIYHNGKRSYEFLGIYLEKASSADVRRQNKEKMRLAESIRAKRELELMYEGSNMTPPNKQKMDLFQFAEQFIAGKSASARRDFKGVMKKFRDFLGRDSFQVKHLNAKMLEDFREYLFTQAGLSYKTPFGYFAKFKTLLKEAYKQGLLQKDISQLVKNRKAPTSERVFLSMDELKRLWNTPYEKPEVPRMYLFACYTGIRHVDIKQLQWKQVQGNQLVLRQHKTAEPLYLALSDTAMRLLGTPGEPEAFIFPKYRNIDTINKHLQKWFKKAGVNKHGTFHTARHTFATNLLMHTNADILTVSKMLGHSSLKHTQIYARIVDTMKSLAANELPSFGDLPDGMKDE